MRENGAPVYQCGPRNNAFVWSVGIYQEISITRHYIVTQPEWQRVGSSGHLILKNMFVMSCNLYVYVSLFMYVKKSNFQSA